jgi:hypothetical protein
MPLDLDKAEADPAMPMIATDSPHSGSGGIKARFSHFVGRRSRAGETVAMAESGQTVAGPDTESDLPRPESREKASLAHAVSALTDEVRRLGVALHLAELKAETRAWRMTAMAAELTRERQAREAERAAAASAAREQDDLRRHYEAEIGRLTMDLSLARIGADDVSGRLLAAQARIAELEAARRSAAIEARAQEAAYRIGLEAAELRIQALAAELKAVRPILAHGSSGAPLGPPEPEPADLPGMFGRGGWRSARRT